MDPFLCDLQVMLQFSNLQHDLTSDVTIQSFTTYLKIEVKFNTYELDVWILTKSNCIQVVFKVWNILLNISNGTICSFNTIRDNSGRESGGIIRDSGITGLPESSGTVRDSGRGLPEIVVEDYQRVVYNRSAREVVALSENISEWWHCQGQW